jgi:hypothetical protein
LGIVFGVLACADGNGGTVVKRRPPTLNASPDGTAGEINGGAGDAATADGPVPDGPAPDQAGPETPDVPDAGSDGSSVDSPADVRSEDSLVCAMPLSLCGSDCYNLAVDPDHCRTCTTVCVNRPLATRTCVDGVCGIRCATGYGNCDGDLVNGCETNLTTRKNCGACGRTPTEVCDGVDNNCDTLIDEGCPRMLMFFTGGVGIFGPTIGAGGSISGGSTCPNPSVATGIAGAESGGVQALGLLCGGAVVITDTSVVPYRYVVRVSGFGPQGMVGSPHPSARRFSYNCPPDTVLDRIEGTVGESIGSLHVYCSALLLTQSPTGEWVLGRMQGIASSTFGSELGMPFNFDVPASATGVPGVFGSLSGRCTIAPSTPALNSFRVTYSHPKLVLR